LGSVKDGKKIVRSFDAMVQGYEGLSAQQGTVTGKTNLAH
jgi:hypothetical protein